MIERDELQAIVRGIQHEIYEDRGEPSKPNSASAGNALVHLYSESVDPTSPEFEKAAQPSGGLGPWPT